MFATATQSKSTRPSEVLADELRLPRRGRLGLMMLGVSVVLVGLLTVGACPASNDKRN